MKRLKEKWGIESNLQFWTIMLVFAITGSSIMFIRRPIFNLLNITEETALWIKVPLYIVVVIPSYQIMLLVIGTIFGQFKFFWEFEKKMFERFKKKKRSDDPSDSE